MALPGATADPRATADHGAAGVRRCGGRLPRRRLLRAVVARLGALVLGVPLLAAPLLGAPAASAAPGDVGVDVVAIGPDVLAPGATLSVTVAVRNEGAEPLVAPLVRLKLAPRLLGSRTAVAGWATADDDAFSGSQVAEVKLPATIGPGAEVNVPLTVPADDLGLPGAPSAWGPRGIAVAVLDAGFAQVALTRTYVVWFPGRSFSSPIRTSVLVPLTGGAPDVATGLVPGDRLEDLTADGARLASVLAAASVPGVTWALDPALLASAAATAPAPGPGSTGWLDRLRSAAADHEVVALPYADPDVAALAHAGVGELHTLAEEQGRDTVQQLLGVPARTDVAWPASGSIDGQTLGVLAHDGRSAVVISQGAQPLTEALPYTPTGRSSLTAGDTAVAGLLVDTPLSTTLAGVGRTAAGPPSTESVADDLLAVQRLLAETAAITMERPSVDRQVLVTAPRDWNPGPETGARALRALTAVPWVEATPLGTLVGTPAPDVERAPLPDAEPDAVGELPAAGLRAAGQALATVRQMAPALTRPEEVLAASERSAVAATSGAWRGDLNRWAEQVAALTASSSALAQGVSVVPGSAINVLSAQADLPLTVSNGLDQDVRVEVRLRPSSGRLVVEQDVPVTIASGGSERVLVPVRAIASGDTEVEVQLRTPAGQVIGEPVVLRVRVRADWENRGTLGLALAAGLVLVVGLVRTIRRGRRPVGTVPAAGARTGARTGPGRKDPS